MYQSTVQSRQTKKYRKGNHRRKVVVGRQCPWGLRKYLFHSFFFEGRYYNESFPSRVVTSTTFFIANKKGKRLMKQIRKLSLVISLVLLLVFTAGCTNNQQDKERATLVVGMECDYAPFNWTQVNQTEFSVAMPDGSFVDGYDVQIARKIADELNMNLEIKKIAWDGLEPALQEGEIDAVIAGMTDTKERRQRVDFTSPYYSSEMVIVVKGDSDLVNAKSIEDFKGRTITSQLNTLPNTVVDQIPNVKHATALGEYPALVMQLNEGIIEGVTAELPVAVGILATNPELKIVEFEEGKGFEIDPADTSVSIAVNKESKDLKNQINQVLSSIGEEERKQMMDDSVERIPATIEELSDNLFTASGQILKTYAPLFLNGIGVTLLLAFSGTILGLLIGLVVGGLRAVKMEERDSGFVKFIKRVVWVVTGFYVEVFRGTPMMVQSIFIYYGLKGLLNWSPLVAGIFVITINTGAYMAEIMRAGIQSVDGGQLEAARSIGMTPFQSMVSIVLPQAIKNSFPSIGNEFVTNIKDSSVLNIIAVTELFYQARSVAGTLYAFVPTYFVVALVYLCLTFPTTRLLDYIEKRMNKQKQGQGGN